jgi:hypothetical protein
VSFAGAVRISLVMRPLQKSRRCEPEPLAPIAEGRWAAWAAWAHREQELARATSADIHSLSDIEVLTDLRCRLPDGTTGRVAIVMDRGGPTTVCHVARLHRVHG